MHTHSGVCVPTLEYAYLLWSTHAYPGVCIHILEDIQVLQGVHTNS